MSEYPGPSSQASQPGSQRLASLSPRTPSTLFASASTKTGHSMQDATSRHQIQGGMYASSTSKTDDNGTLEGFDVGEGEYSDLFEDADGAAVDFDNEDDDEDEDDETSPHRQGGRGGGSSGGRQTRRRRSSASVGSTGKSGTAGGTTSPRSPRRVSMRQKRSSGGGAAGSGRNKLTTPERRPNSSIASGSSGPRVSPLAKRLGEDIPFMLPHPSRATETSNIYPGVVIGSFAGGAGDDTTLGFGVGDIADVDDILDRSAAIGPSVSASIGQPAGTNIAPWLMDDGPASPALDKSTAEQVPTPQHRKQTLPLNHFSSVPHLPKIRRHGTKGLTATPHSAGAGVALSGVAGVGSVDGLVGFGAESGTTGSGESHRHPNQLPSSQTPLGQGHGHSQGHSGSRDDLRFGSDPAMNIQGPFSLSPATREVGRSRNGSQDSTQTVNFGGLSGPSGSSAHLPSGSSNTSLGNAPSVSPGTGVIGSVSGGRIGKRGTSPSGSTVELPSSLLSRHGSLAQGRVSRFGSTASVASSHGNYNTSSEKKKGGFLGSLLKRKTGQSMSQASPDFNPSVHRGSASDSASSRLSSSTTQSSLNKVTSADYFGQTSSGGSRHGSHASERGAISPLQEIGEQEFQLDMNLDDMEGIVDPTFALSPPQPPPALGQKLTTGDNSNNDGPNRGGNMTHKDGSPSAVLYPGQSGATTASDATGLSLEDALNNTSSFATTISVGETSDESVKSSNASVSSPISKSPGRSVVAAAQRESGAFNGRPNPFQTPMGSPASTIFPGSGSNGSGMGDQPKLTTNQNNNQPLSPHSISPKHSLPSSTQPRRPSQLRNVKTGSLDSEASSEASGPLQPLAPSWAQYPNNNQLTLFHDPFGATSASNGDGRGEIGGLQARENGRGVSPSRISSLTPVSRGQSSFSDDPSASQPRPTTSSSVGVGGLAPAASISAAAAWAAPESWGVEADDLNEESTTSSSSEGDDDGEWEDDGATPGSTTPAAVSGAFATTENGVVMVNKDGTAGGAGINGTEVVLAGRSVGTSGDLSKPPPFGAKSLAAKKSGVRPPTAGGKKSKGVGRPSTANRPGTGGRPGTSGSAHTASVNHYTRIYRADGSYSVMAFPLLTTTSEIINILAGGADGKKVSTSMRLYVRERGQDRQLLPSEKPLGIQARRLAQAGYTEAEHIEEIGKEDLSLLCKFIYQTPVLPVMNPDEESSYESFEFIDISGRDLQVIPIFLHLHAHNIIILNVSRNPMTDLPLDFIQACSSLRELKMSNMALKRVPASIRASETLARLDLSCNRIADLESVQLNEISTLLSLKVQNNKLSSIPSYFAQMKALKYLNISNNKFETFPSVVCEMSNLVDLDASFNSIAELPSEMSNLRSLERLSVVGNELTSFPESFSTLENLRVLDVRRNKLTDLTSVYALPNLATLRADRNDLVTLDTRLGAKVRDFSVPHNSITRFTLASFPSMTQAYSLTSLDLSHGKLSTLDDGALAELVNLVHLNLNFNQFTRLPSTIGCLLNLETFSATDNMINLIPQGFGQLMKLRDINLHNNNLKEIPSDMWFCASLEIFNASSNLLETLADPPPSWVEQMAQAGLNSDSSRKMSTVSTMSNSTDKARMVPPAGHSCKYIYLADNRLTDDVFHQIALLYNMRTLNLSFNDIHEIPLYTLSRCEKLEALYVSGNKLTSLPTEDLERLHNLKTLYLNGNKLQTLPSELGAIKGLQHLDVGSNVLKYNIANWPYDWNWNWNTALKYLNLSGNKRLEIKPTSGQDLSHASSFRKELSDFTALTDLRVLGLMDVTLRIPSLPDETDEKRIRTSFSDINNMAYGISDTLGSVEHLAMFDLAVPNFRGRDNECIFGMFGRATPAVPSGKIPKYVQENFAAKLADELDSLRAHESPNEALRRSFLYINKDCFDFLAGTEKRRKGSDASYITVNSLQNKKLSNISSQLRTGSSGAVVYLVDKTLHVANAGDILVVLSRKGEAELLSKRHDPTDREETARIRRAEAWVSTKGWVNDDKEIDISRAFGFYHASPAINASPEIRTRDLAESDEFLIIGNHPLWKCCSYQTAVDIARTERDDPMMAAQKLRDFAISYGAEGSIMVMVVNISDLFFGRGFNRVRGLGSGPQQIDSLAETEWAKRPNRRRADEVGDRTLNRLQQEVEPPTGQVAIVFTDIVNSTALWETNPGMPTAIKMHHSLMRRQLRLDGGYEVKTEGDSFMVSFPSVPAAVLWAMNCQIMLLQQEWPRELLESEDGKVIYDSEGNIIHRGLRVRMGVHWGSPECERDPITRRMDYYGPMVNRSARINASADGGQLMASQDVIMEIQRIIDASNNNDESSLDEYFPDAKREAAELRRIGLVMKDMGERKLKGLEVPEKLQLLYPKPLAGRLEMWSGLRANVEVNEAKTFNTQRQNDLDEVRQLAVLTLRLEALSSLASHSHTGASGGLGPHSGSPNSPRSPPSGPPKVDYSPSSGADSSNVKVTGSGSGSARKSPGTFKIMQGQGGPSHVPNSAAMGSGDGRSNMVVQRRVGQNHTTSLPSHLGPTIRDDISDEELCEIIESLTTRIENVMSTLYIKHLGGFASVLAALERATRIDSNLLVHAMSLMSGAMNTSSA